MDMLRGYLSSISAAQHNDNNNNDEDGNKGERFGIEWLYFEEPAGFFLPRMQLRRHLLELDQVSHVLHYDNYRRVMRIRDISLVTAVEEHDSDGRQKWWMTIQDPEVPQVWVVHFPSLDRLLFWTEIIKAVARVTKSPAIVSDLVYASTCEQQQDEEQRQQRGSRDDTLTCEREKTDLHLEPASDVPEIEIAA